MPYRIVILGSTGGSVLSRVGASEFVRDATLEVVTDRSCGILQVAKYLGLTSVVLPSRTGTEFSEALLQRYGNRDDIVFLSFYTRLLSGELLTRHRGRIFNCHPSILPSFKGMHGFEDTLASSSQLMGCSLHQVDAGMDSGSIIIQAALPLDRSLPLAENRHKVFLAQVYTTLQFFRWVSDGRLKVTLDGLCHIEGLQYRVSAISPNLDPDFFAYTGLENELRLN